MNIRYRVELSEAERTELETLLSGGKHAARKLKRAQILLAADAGAGDEEIARTVGAGGWRRTISSRGVGTCGATPRSMAPTSPAWRMCSTSMLRPPIRSGRWCAS